MSSNINFDPLTGKVNAIEFAGHLTGNVTGNVTGDLTGDVSGDVSGSSGSCTGSSSSCSGNAASSTYATTSGTSGTCTGNAGSSTYATNTTITDDIATAATMYPTWVTATTGNLPQKTSSTKLTFNPSTGMLTATGFTGALTGNAGSSTYATNVTITNDTTTAATMYPTWVTATTGNLPQKTSSTKLTFNPSTGTLTSTVLAGRLNPRANGTTSSSTPTPNADTDDLYYLTALAAAPTFGAPTGTPVNGQKLMIRIKDNATARALAWNAIYRAGTDVPLPTTTVISKTMYVGFVYNTADSKWDLAGFVDGI